MVTRDNKRSLVGDASFPDILGSWVFGDDPETPNNWNFYLARDEPGIPFSPDVVGVLYPLAFVDTGDHWVNWDEYVDYCVSGGGANTFGGAEVIRK